MAFIRAQIDSEGLPPTRQEIAAHMGYRSTNAAHEVLLALKAKGKIELKPGLSRGIRVLE